jgi:hypothetical protein
MTGGRNRVRISFNDARMRNLPPPLQGQVAHWDESFQALAFACHKAARKRLSSIIANRSSQSAAVLLLDASKRALKQSDCSQNSRERDDLTLR